MARKRNNEHQLVVQARARLWENIFEIWLVLEPDLDKKFLPEDVVVIRGLHSRAADLNDIPEAKLLPRVTQELQSIYQRLRGFQSSAAQNPDSNVDLLSLIEALEVRIHELFEGRRSPLLIETSLGDLVKARELLGQDDSEACRRSAKLLYDHARSLTSYWGI